MGVLSAREGRGPAQRGGGVGWGGWGWGDNTVYCVTYHFEVKDNLGDKITLWTESEWSHDLALGNIFFVGFLNSVQLVPTTLQFYKKTAKVYFVKSPTSSALSVS